MRITLRPCVTPGVGADLGPGLQERKAPGWQQGGWSESGCCWAGWCVRQTRAKQDSEGTEGHPQGHTRADGGWGLGGGVGRVRAESAGLQVQQKEVSAVGVSGCGFYDFYSTLFFK